MESKPRSSVPWVALSLAILVLVIVLYVLSSGPMYAACTNGLVTADTFGAAYYPVFWLVYQIDGPVTGPSKRLFIWHLRLWDSWLGGDQDVLHPAA